MVSGIGAGLFAFGAIYQIITGLWSIYTGCVSMLWQRADRAVVPGQFWCVVVVKVLLLGKMVMGK